MLKKVVEFENFDGVITKKTLWFNFTKGEVMEMEMRGDQGLFAKMKQIINADNQDDIIDIFKELVLKAYGVRDGNDFIKNQDLRDRFASSEAYSELFIELTTNATAAVEFFSGIMPKGLEEVAEKVARQPDIPQEQIDAMMKQALAEQGKLPKASAEVVDMVQNASQNTTVPILTPPVRVDVVSQPLANGIPYDENDVREPINLTSNPTV